MVWAKASRGVWGQGYVCYGKLYLTCDICKHDQIPEQLKGGVPCAVRALCEKLAVLHHREFGKFRRLEGRH